MCLSFTAVSFIGSQSGLRHVTVYKMKEELLKRLADLSPLLPTNSLDELIDGLGGPEKVSEVSLSLCVYIVTLIWNLHNS